MHRRRPYDSRLDGKFEAWLSRVPAEGLRWLQAKTANHLIAPWRTRPFEDWDLRDLRATDDERRAASLMAGLLIRDQLREIWASYKAPPRGGGAPGGRPSRHA